ncbi:YidH family protein [Streptacidiphilus monticola]|uniref:YidH family protein n=1 Tax=Streptacidiphilus monticola TaxID=2161674 RepID=A0ABW1G025_9ACTN
MSARPRPHRPWDPGLQPERTALAWQRTTLAYCAGGLGLAKLAEHHHQLGLTVLILATTLPAGGVLTLLAGRRARRVETGLREGRPPAAGRLHQGLTALALVLGAASLGYVLLVP